MRVARVVLIGVLWLLCLALILLDSPTPGVAAAAPTGQDAVHQVQRGDDLRLIAGYYYGDTRQWERIWRANRAQVPRPNRIVPGTLLRIPDAMVPAESYAGFLVRVHRPAVGSRAPVVELPPVVGPAAASASPAAPGTPGGPDALAPPPPSVPRP